MGNSMSTVKGLCSWLKIRWSTVGSTASVFQGAHQSLASRSFSETETVFRDILDKGGNIAYGEFSSEWDGYSTWSARDNALKTTLLRGYVTRYSIPYYYPSNIL